MMPAPSGPELPETVELLSDNVAPVLLSMPAPLFVAVLFEKVELFVTVSVPEELKTPPPYGAELVETVELLSDAVPLLLMAPPFCVAELPEKVTEFANS